MVYVDSNWPRLESNCYISNPYCFGSLSATIDSFFIVFDSFILMFCFNTGQKESRDGGDDDDDDDFVDTPQESMESD